MRRVELIFDGDCPNAEATRERLKTALVAAGLPPRWKEWCRSDPGTPARVRRFGSPTILVDGRDVAGLVAGEEGSSCRLYASPGGGLGGVPAAETITSALMSESPRHGWRGALTVLPAVGTSLLPIGTCPACWPAYAGLLSSLGLGFLFNSAYLLPVMAAFLALAVATLAFRANSRRGFLPFALGLLAAGVALVGKFALSSNPVLFVGLGLLVAASVWNSWPRRATTTDSCPACARQDRQASI